MVLIVLSVIGGLIFYFAFTGPNFGEIYAEKLASGEIVNPVEGLTDEEAIAAFDETFVYYLLVNIKAYNLHEPPLSDDKPVMKVYVGDEVFNAKVSEGEIDIGRGEINTEDIILRTSASEAVKMIRDKSYIEQSFENGESKIELIASETTLFSKGYLTLYTELTGKTLSDLGDSE